MDRPRRTGSTSRSARQSSRGGSAPGFAFRRPVTSRASTRLRAAPWWPRSPSCGGGLPPVHRGFRHLRRRRPSRRAARGRAAARAEGRATPDPTNPALPVRPPGAVVPGARAPEDPRLPHGPSRARAVPVDALGAGRPAGSCAGPRPGCCSGASRSATGRCARRWRRYSARHAGRGARPGRSQSSPECRRRSTSRRGCWSTPATGCAWRSPGYGGGRPCLLGRGRHARPRARWTPRGWWSTAGASAERGSPTSPPRTSTRSEER